MRLTLFAYLAIAFLLTACAAPFQSCAQQAAPAITQLQSIAREWDDAAKLADQTPRMQLAVQIASLQAIRRRAQDVQMPECAATAKTALVDAMDNTIEGFTAFLGQKPDTEVKAFFARASDRMKAFTEAMSHLDET